MLLNRDAVSRSPLNRTWLEYDTPITAADATVRFTKARVKITYTDPSLDEDITMTSSGAAYGTSANHAADAQIGSPYKWFSLQGSSTLDGTCFPGDSDSVGWWSDDLADEDGAFDPAVWLQIEFATPRTIHNFFIEGDDKIGCYPRDFELVAYDEEDTALETITVSNNELMSWENIPDSAVFDVKRIRVTVTKINLPNRSCMITEMFSAYSETYETDEIMEVRIFEEQEFSSGTIPIGNISSNECSVKLANDTRKFDFGNPVSPIKDLLLKNRKIEVWLGIEVPYASTSFHWYKKGVFWSQDWSVPEDDIYAEVVGFDRLELMRTTEFYSSQVYEGYTLGALAELIFDDADLTEETDYWIHPDLYDYTVPYAWFGRTTHRAALKKIAGPALAKVYCDGHGVIIIEPYDPRPVSRVTFTTDKFKRKDNPVAFSEVLNYIEVIAAPRVESSEIEVYSDTEELVVPAGGTATRFCIFDTDDPCIDVQEPGFQQSGADISIDSYTAYTWALSVTFINVGATDQTVTEITIDGTPVVIAGEKRIVAEDEDSIRAYGRMTLAEPIENDFIQTEAQAQLIADTLLASNKDTRRDVTIEAFGYIDLNLGDRIKVVSYRNLHPKEYMITSQEILFDGKLRANYKARRI